MAYTAKGLQQALIAHGYDLGRGGADGLIGASTLDALMRFETKECLETGEELLKALADPKDTAGSMRMSAEGRAVLTEREALRTTAYKDSVGVWTIGVGHTAAAGPPVPKAGMTITRQEAEDLFARDLVQYEDAVNKALKAKVSQQQFDALVSICYNIGVGNMAGSTFIKRINAGDSPDRVAEAILMWNKPPEVQSRRRGEALQYKSTAKPKARA